MCRCFCLKYSQIFPFSNFLSLTSLGLEVYSKLCGKNVVRQGLLMMLMLVQWFDMLILLSLNRHDIVLACLFSNIHKNL